MLILIIDGAAKSDTESWHTQRPHLADFWNLLIWAFFVNGWKSYKYVLKQSTMQMNAKRILVMILFANSNPKKCRAITKKSNPRLGLVIKYVVVELNKNSWLVKVINNCLF